MSRPTLQFLSIFTILLWAVSLPPLAAADDKKADEKKADSAAAKEPSEKKEEPLPEGHSGHGEVFNEGPRQAAYLMDGVGRVKFDVTTKSDDARAFFLQGVAQLHGFWYFESERSFRQAAVHDPECAMTYWGMAMSNRRNLDRAKGFIKEAMDRKDKVSKRERMYIEAFSKWANAKTETSEEKKKRAENYMTALDDIAIEYPDDLEAKAFLCEFHWSARRAGLKIRGYSTVDALLGEILRAEPLHPAHHYRIHLWDSKKAENAVESAARCGMSAPAIAHMWHMPGHIYSRLKRYHDAVYQQEASARVDHAHMMKDRVLPDQIHNFAHNNEWCIRNLVHIGRVSGAIDLAMNMIELPRHPKYNHIGKSGSFKYGHQRLLDVLRTYQLHEQIVQLAETPYLAKTENSTEDLKSQRYIACAQIATGNLEAGQQIRSELKSEIEDQEAKKKKAGDEAEATAKKEKKSEKDTKKAPSSAESKFRTRIKELQKAIDEIDGRIAIHEKRYEDALALFKKSGSVPVEEQVIWMLEAGKTDDAVKKIDAHVRTNVNEVLPLALQTIVHLRAKKPETAKKAFEKLLPLSADLDMSVPVLAQLNAAAEELGFGKDWVQPVKLPTDLGARPPLDSLGPFRWQPQAAPEWSLPGVDGDSLALDDYRGRPLFVIFYLGHGCLHCAEQLQKFHPKAQQFRDAGFDIVAISTDKQEVLDEAFRNLDEPFAFPLLADSGLETFKAYRCFDDFEQQPLHGTFLIDGAGRIRWQDISYEPFMDPDFVLEEAQRLLQQDDTTPARLIGQAQSDH